MVLANAQHVKNVPGRKTDAKDSEWIAELLQPGLLRSSYIPPEIIRDLRGLTRGRATLSQEASRLASRIQNYALVNGRFVIDSGKRTLVLAGVCWTQRHDAGPG
jgi:transposase